MKTVESKTQSHLLLEKEKTSLINELHAKTSILRKLKLYIISEPRLANSIINTDAGSVTFVKKHIPTATIKFQHLTSHTWKVQNKLTISEKKPEKRAFQLFECNTSKLYNAYTCKDRMDVLEIYPHYRTAVHFLPGSGGFGGCQCG